MTTHSFTTPVGRFVGGDLFTPRTKDFDGRPMTTRDGQPRSEYICQVAFPKSDAGTETIRREIFSAAVEAFPALFPGGQPGPQAAVFSYKWTDGDDQNPNMRGVKPCDREGFPGHWVLTFKSSFAPQIFDQNIAPIVDPKAIKRGDYVRVAATCKGNGQANKPGVYLSHSMVQLMGYGEAIKSGPDAAAAFAAPAALPPGASTTPVAPSTPMPGTALGGVPGPAPTPPRATPPMPGAPGPAPTPAPGFGSTAAPAPPPPPAAAPAGPQTLPGCPHTYAELSAGGWTDEQMRTKGWLA